MWLLHLFFVNKLYLISSERRVKCLTGKVAKVLLLQMISDHKVLAIEEVDYTDILAMIVIIIGPPFFQSR